MEVVKVTPESPVVTVCTTRFQTKIFHVLLFLNKTNKMHEFPKLYFVKKLYMFRAFPLPSSGVFFYTFDIGIFLVGLMTPSKQGQDVGHTKCPKHVEFFDKIKFGKFVRLVGFIKKKFVTMLGHMNVK